MDISGAASQIIDIGIALNAERDLDRLMEKILFEAIDLSSADGGHLLSNRGRSAPFRNSENQIARHSSGWKLG